MRGTGGERGREAGRQGWSTEALQRPVVLAEELLCLERTLAARCAMTGKGTQLKGDPNWKACYKLRNDEGLNEGSDSRVREKKVM